MSINVDPDTGLKIFDTRAAKATDKIEGKGYSRRRGRRRSRSLPPNPPAPCSTPRSRRSTGRSRRPGGARPTTCRWRASSPGTSRTSTRRRRSSASRSRTSARSSWSAPASPACCCGTSCAQAGFDDVRFCEKGGDVGGTWYWNRYPGIACDVESYSYFPLLEEMGYFPTMKFASGFEIFEYCQKMAEKFGFYDHCLFHTTVEQTEWDEDTGRWTVYTDRGDAMRARFVDPRQRHPHHARSWRASTGMETFEGESFHTSRWNYDVDLEGKRVGIIGTGATAVQAIPELAKVVERALRVPAHAVHHRRARPAGHDARRRSRPGRNEPGWARARRARFAKISAGRTAIKANDDYLAGKVADFRERKAARRRAVARGADPEAARRQLPHHGADPGAGGRHRQGPEDGGGAEAVLPLRLQAADVPRRVPADVQPAARAPRRHRADGRAARSTSAASSTTAWSTRSTC